MLNNKLRNELRTICKMQIADFTGDRFLSQFDNVTVVHTEHGPLVHIDNGGSILGVAHLDTVGNQNAKCKIKRDVAKCIKLDDRLGVWVLLRLLPLFDDMPKYDILLTDSEETANSTAQHFQTDKPYNWLFEFDRAGCDVVMYDYLTDEYERLLESFGFIVGWGSFSDICYLEQLQVAGFNFGVGYHKQHSPSCFADLSHTVMQAKLFREFAIANCDILLSHTPKPKTSYVTRLWIGDDDDRGTIDTVCEECYQWIRDDWSYCPFCGIPTNRNYKPTYRDDWYDDDRTGFYR